jgi:hypothetical protein
VFELPHDSIWPTDISPKLKEYADSRPHLSPECRILFGDDIHVKSEGGWEVGVGEISIETFSKYREPNGYFIETIETKPITENGNHNNVMRNAMTHLIVDYCRRRKHPYCVIILCNSFSPREKDIELEIKSSSPSTFQYLERVLTVTPLVGERTITNGNGKAVKRSYRLPPELQPRDFNYKQFIGKIFNISNEM